MIFVDYLGAAVHFARVRGVVREQLAKAMRVPPDQVRVRRLVTDDDGEDVELWVELSSDEQLYRLGRTIARGVADGVQATGGPRDVWVMFRVVPLSNAFLNGEPRARGTHSFE